ncbi:MAG: DsbA family protein [Actinomycetota bacterium]|nr:DsbA family protein [Actinomycetota bacterium]
MAGSSTASAEGAEAGPCFYFDLASPEAYLVAERILALAPAPCAWVPVREAGLPGGFGAWRCAEERDIELARLERTAADRGLQPVRWPTSLPFDSTLALRAATYARGGGKTVPFALAAFRQAYAGGRDLSREEGVLLAGAACEIHPRALLAGAGTARVAAELDRATAQARERGVRFTPAVWVAGEVFHGDDGLERAVATLRALC